MENKSKGKTMVIVIFVLAVLGLGGYIIYDKFIKVKTTEPEVKNEINDNKETEENEPTTKLTGYYKFGTTYSTDEDPCDPENISQKHGETIEILFNESGTYKSAYGADCGGGYTWDGTYTINGDKLVLKCNDYDSPCVEGEYRIGEYNTIINDKNEIYSKVEKSQLQVFEEQ